MKRKENKTIWKRWYMIVAYVIFGWMFIVSPVITMTLDAGTAENQSKNNPYQNTYTNTNSITTTKSWYPIGSFEGTSSKTTDTFTTSGSKFKITYSVIPDNAYSYWSTFIYEEKYGLYVGMYTLDKGTETSIIYEGPGTYYLDVGAANLKSWDVSVYEYR